jgi:site-specific recombinase XerD
MKAEELIKPEHVTLKHLTRANVESFLEWIEKIRKCSISTRNVRLAAIHSFVDFLQYNNVQGLNNWHSILAIKCKKSKTPVMDYINVDGMKLILNQPDLSTKNGRRDFTVLSLLYDCAVRVQEAIDVTCGDIRFGEVTTIHVLGKGMKERVIPLSVDHARNLKKYMIENNMLRPEMVSHPLLSNRSGNKLSRMAILNIVKKHCDQARKVSPDIIPKNIGCHTFRRSKAMHLLEADVNLVAIRDFLGHAHITTTEIYARASEKKKQEALAKLNPGIRDIENTSWNRRENSDLLSYLKSLQTKY